MADGSPMAAISQGYRKSIYARFPAADREVKVSTAGGSQPRWRGDGKELYYIAPDGMLMAVPIEEGEAIAPGVPEALFPIRVRRIGRGRHWPAYDVTSDGQRFLVANLTEEAGRTNRYRHHRLAGQGPRLGKGRTYAMAQVVDSRKSRRSP